MSDRPEDARRPRRPRRRPQTGTLDRAASRSSSAPAGSSCRSLTAVLAFLIGGLVVAATGHNPLLAYRDIFNGAGLNWIFHPTTNVANTAAYNLSQTLLQTTTLILMRARRRVRVPLRHVQHRRPGPVLHRALSSRTGSASTSPGMSPLPHILLAIGAATLAGAAWAGIAGFLKATVGAHEVISTIMLNWIAIWVGEWLFGDGGPLQNSAEQDRADLERHRRLGASCPVFWGEQGLQGLHIGFFVALAALVVFWLVLNRTTLGYEVRAVGFNPEAAAYGGISVKKNLIRAMAISGAFAGLAGALDMLGYLYHFGAVRHPGQLGRLPRDRGRAARPQHRGRRRPRRAALRRAALRHDARPHVERDPARARRQPHVHHPGARRALRRRRRAHPLRLELAPEAAAEPDARPRWRRHERVGASGSRTRSARACATRRRPATSGILLGVFAAFLAIPPIEARTITWPIARRHRRRAARDLDGHARPAPARLGRGRGRHDRHRARHPRDALRHGEPRTRSSTRR